MSKAGGLAGMQFQKKSFSVPMGDVGEDVVRNIMSDEDRERLATDEGKLGNDVIATRKKRHVLPFGDRILVRRRKIGGTIGSGLLVSADETKERDTEIADVIFIPEHSFTDSELIKNSEMIAKALSAKAQGGDSDALNALLKFNEFLKIKSIQPGDVVLISKYVGITFYTSDDIDGLTMLLGNDVIGLVCEEGVK